MADLKAFVTDIWEELDGATRYAGLAMSHAEDKQRAQTYKEMAAQEIQHAEKLWTMFGDQIEKCKKELSRRRGILFGYPQMGTREGYGQDSAPADGIKYHLILHTILHT